MLENDLSSVFQLYNMKSIEKPVGKSGEKVDLQEGISSLVEENAKLKVELNDSKKHNEELETRLKNSKVCYHSFHFLFFACVCLMKGLWLYLERFVFPVSDSLHSLKYDINGCAREANRILIQL